MIVHFEDSPTPPACWNREAFPEGRYRVGLEEQTGERVVTWVSNKWASAECQSWAPGIGQPTEEYPSGTPYPVAHGWLPWCKQCRWMPDDVAPSL